MHFSSRSSLLLLLSSLTSLAAAETTTGCNPLYAACPADPGLGTSVNIDFTQGQSSYFETLSGADLISYDSSNGLDVAITGLGQFPTLASDFFIFFGKVEAVVQAAPGVGIVSSLVLLSDDDDEIDLEWVGGDNYHVQSNYFSKGYLGTYNRGGIHDVNDPVGSFHTYTIDWSEEQILWQIDGVTVRTFTAASATQGYPQTPMQVKIGSWVGGDPSNAPGTIAWAGGLSDFSQAPFNFYIKSLAVTDYSSGKEYKYTDTSGNADSIEVIGGDAADSSSAVASSSAAATTTTSLSSSSSSSLVVTTTSAVESSTVSEVTTSIPSSTFVSSSSFIESTTSVEQTSSVESTSSAESSFAEPSTIISSASAVESTTSIVSSTSAKPTTPTESSSSAAPTTSVASTTSSEPAIVVVNSISNVPSSSSVVAPSSSSSVAPISSSLSSSAAPISLPIANATTTIKPSTFIASVFTNSSSTLASSSTVRPNSTSARPSAATQSTNAGGIVKISSGSAILAAIVGLIVMA
ncbi:hypothetical protein V1514DRAFT_327364 [Lipomyces japonicus]|uniref:uncharacterized protein n=1 Tax=Lipomyces japonicus TaxID=56871 RepID=UPI0034CDF86B